VKAGLAGLRMLAGQLAGVRSRKRGNPTSGFVRAIAHVVMREPFASNVPLSPELFAAAKAEYHRAWRNERRRLRQEPRSRKHSRSAQARRARRAVEREIERAAARRLASVGGAP